LKKKILIVGGTGFIGYHLAKKCLEKNFSVTSLSFNKPKKLRFLKKINYIHCDISKKKALKKTIKEDFDYVVNLGGYVNHHEKKKTFNSHYKGCKYLAEIFLKKNIKSFIQIGSSVEYGHTRSPQLEKKIDFNKKLNSTYGQAKLLASKYLINLYNKYKFPLKIIRLYLVYGPKQDNNRLIPFTINACLLNKKFPCSSGIQKRDFLYIDDLVKVILKCLNNSKLNGKSFNIGFGKSYKVKDVIEIIRKYINYGNPIYGKIKLRKDEIQNLYPKITLAKKLLKWKPTMPIKKGLKLTINAYKK